MKRRTKYRVRGRVRVEVNQATYEVEMRERGLEIRRLRHRKIYRVSIEDIIDMAEGQLHLQLFPHRGPEEP